MSIQSNSASKQSHASPTSAANSKLHGQHNYKPQRTCSQVKEAHGSPRATLPTRADNKEKVGVQGTANPMLAPNQSTPTRNTPTNRGKG
ncbi:hypothetical protein C1H46_017200 [Malus baccata]|uniref:Uncharacterized protein n=1 Tax=Malus baccata TaxID=106549 RepID=A0A540MEF5_MALBA|nr:hypothetical protein C1H46_017200 [Malus baccata]